MCDLRKTRVNFQSRKDRVLSVRKSDRSLRRRDTAKSVSGQTAPGNLPLAVIHDAFARYRAPDKANEIAADSRTLCLSKLARKRLVRSADKSVDLIAPHVRRHPRLRTMDNETFCIYIVRLLIAANLYTKRFHKSNTLTLISCFIFESFLFNKLRDTLECYVINNAFQ